MHPGFFQTFWSWLLQQLNNYIAVNTARVANAIEPAAVTLAALYVMAWGYLQLTGRIEEPFATGVQRIARLVIVLGVGLHLWLYNDVIVDTFYRAPAQLASAVVGSGDPVATVDAIWAQGASVAENLFKQAGSFDISFLTNKLMGIVIWLLIGMLCVYVMFLIALASIASAVLLAIGPLFVTLCLFDCTRRFFEAWVAQLANYALITILTVLVSALLLGVMKSYAVQTATQGPATKVVDSLDMLLLAGLTLLLMRQILPIAAALAGGLALSSLNAVSGTLRSSLPTSRILGGAIGAARHIGQTHSAESIGGQGGSGPASERGTQVGKASELPAR